MELNSVAKSNLANAVSFSGHSRQQIKSLAGFEKHHRIPEGDIESRLRFLGRIASDNVGRDLDEVFGKLKSVFGFKRRELAVDGPVDGSGSIATPAFDYRIGLQLDPTSDDHVLWQRSISGIRQPDTVFCNEFRKAFGDSLGFLQIALSTPLDIKSIIDRVEDSPGGECSIDYDRDATWCEIKVIDSPTTMRIDEDQISVKGAMPLSPAELFEHYWRMQQKFLETIDLPG